MIIMSFDKTVIYQTESSIYALFLMFKLYRIGSSCLELRLRRNKLLHFFSKNKLSLEMHIFEFETVQKIFTILVTLFLRSREKWSFTVFYCEGRTKKVKKTS